MAENKGDLISRSYVLSEMTELHQVTSEENMRFEDFTEIIDNAPTVEEKIRGLATIDKNGDIKIELLRTQGEWIDEGIYAEGHNEHAYTCSKCGFQIIENKNSLLENRFCKNCGADMRKGAEND